MKKVSTNLKEAGKTEHFCRVDAEVAAERLTSNNSMYHSLEVEVQEKKAYWEVEASQRSIKAEDFFNQVLAEELDNRAWMVGGNQGCGRIIWCLAA